MSLQDIDADISFYENEIPNLKSLILAKNSGMLTVASDAARGFQVEKNLALVKRYENDIIEINEKIIKFEKELQRRMANADKELGRQVGEIGNNIKNYTVDVQKYATELNEKVTKYKWYLQQYAYFYGLYTTGVTGMARPPKAEQSQDVKIPKKQATQSTYGENEG